MAVLKLRKYISKHTFNDTINFWSNRPWKNPNVGKTSEREGVLLISSNLEITSAKIKPTVYLSLPRFPCLKNDWKKYTHNNLEIRALTHSRTVRTVSSLNAVRFTLKNVPRIYYSRTAAVRPVRNS